MNLWKGRPTVQGLVVTGVSAFVLSFLTQTLLLPEIPTRLILGWTAYATMGTLYLLAASRALDWLYRDFVQRGAPKPLATLLVIGVSGAWCWMWPLLALGDVLLARLGEEDRA